MFIVGIAGGTGSGKTTLVRPMHLQFIEPSGQFADIIVQQDGEKYDAAGMLITVIMVRMNDDL